MILKILAWLVGSTLAFFVLVWGMDTLIGRYWFSKLPAKQQLEIVENHNKNLK